MIENINMPEVVRVPILDELAPNGFFYRGGRYIVEFTPDSLWYETSLWMTRLAIRDGTKTEYHVFQHFPSEAAEALSRLGVDVEKSKTEGLLDIWDSYSQASRYEEEIRIASASGLRIESTPTKPLDVKKSAGAWANAAKAGFPLERKRWLHFDDNCSIFLPVQ